MVVLFTSDLHFFHTRILDYCPGRRRYWSTVEEMNEGLIERWNSKVKKGDMVYVVGDCALGPKKREFKTLIRPRLNGLISLVPGNHDHDHKGALVDLGVDWVAAYEHSVWVGETCCIMRHIPIVDRGERWRREYDYMLCGHVHEQWPRVGNVINVGVDVSDFYPLTFEELLARDPVEKK